MSGTHRKVGNPAGIIGPQPKSENRSAKRSNRMHRKHGEERMFIRANVFCFVIKQYAYANIIPPITAPMAL